MKPKIVDIHNIENILVKVEEAIDPSNLKDFFFTIFHKHNIEIKDDSRIFFSFLKEKKYYQISIFNMKKSLFVTQLDILCQFHQKRSSSHDYELYVFIDYFAIFISKKLYYYQKIDKHTPLKELKVFLEVKFNISIKHEHHIEMTKVEKSLISTYKEEFCLSLEYLNITKLSNHFLKYIVYISILLFLLIYAFFENFHQNIDKELNLHGLEKEYVSLLQSKVYQENISLDFIEIFSYIQKEKLILKSIVYDNHGYKIQLQNKKRDGLLKFIKYFKQSQVETIFENGVMYEMQATIVM